jgi:hypothetical protein
LDPHKWEQYLAEDFSNPLIYIVPPHTVQTR